LLCLLLALTMAACGTSGSGSASGSGSSVFRSIFEADLSARAPGGYRGDSGDATTAQAAGDVMYLGAGGPRDEGGGESVSSFEPGEFSLNFQNADLREVVQSILGDALQLNYTVDPNVSGTVTMSSARPVAKDDLIPILEIVLQMNGAALVRDGEIHRVVAETAAVAGYADVGEARPGYGISILPLRYVAAQTLINLIDGFGARPGSVRAEAARNLLIVLGNGPDREAAIETALSFDADWMQDQSVAILPLQRAKAETVISELERVFKAQEGGVAADIIQFMPMPRLNAVLAVSQQRDLIERARTWVSRLDSDNPDLENMVYVYRVKYRDAKVLADLLNQIFTGAAATEPADAEEQIEPGATPVVSEGFAEDSESGFDMEGGGEGEDEFGDDGFGERLGESFGGQGDLRAGPPSDALAAAAPVTAESGPGGVRIRADTNNNSIIIYANLEARKDILAALARIDVPQLQVAINVTMAEIRLTDELRYGVQYFVKSGSVGLGDDEGSIGLFNAAASTINPEVPGFNFIIGSNRNPDVIISAFDEITDVQVLSSPSLVVLENQTARFQVGDQIPIVTRTVSDPRDGDDDFVTSNEVEYRDTGIILSVKPRVAENGGVALEIEQEISSVTGQANSLTPIISNRRVASSISVTDGQTVLLGGLISEQSDRGRSGIPGLHRLKGIGALFGTRDTGNVRNELIILIRPSVIRDGKDAQHVAEELRSRLWSLGATQAR
jgi:general secretion pathway protein D